MRKFATVEMKEVKGSMQTFEKLYVETVCFIDEFVKEIQDNPQYSSEYKTILSYMNFFANGQMLPETKFRVLKGGKGDIKRFEFKSKNLRIYAIANSGGKLVIMGGFKKNQERDINKLNAIAKDYINYIKNQAI